jgi:endonuclease G
MSRAIVAIPALLGVLTAVFLEPSENLRIQIHRRPAFLSVVGDPVVNFGAQELEWVEDHCPFGMPVVNPAAGYGGTIIAAHEGYVLELGLVDKIPLWVCERVASSQLDGDAERLDDFVEDPSIPDEYESNEDDYYATGYDRGHQAPAGNQSASQRLNDETFFYSNMSPQAPYLNRTIWQLLENRTRDWVTPQAPAFIVTGPVFHDSQEESNLTADGLVEHYAIGPGGVSAPTHCYKIVLQQRGGAWSAIAFVLENRNHRSPYDLADYITSIDWIEARTGIDFFPDMPGAQQAALEAAVSPMW